ncbi:sensor histidine kinase [Mucilaginibacter phyllosphaerae]
MLKFTPKYAPTAFSGEFSINWNGICYHFIGWVFFILLEMSLYVYSSRSFSLTGKYALYYVVNISLFYSHLWILHHTLSQDKKKYWRLILLVLIQLVLFLFIKTTVDYFTIDLSKEKESMPSALRRLAAMNLYRSIFFIWLSSVYWTASNVFNLERKAKEAEIRELTASKDALNLAARLAKSDNALLRQQINPHLLFNSLNFIHSSVYQVSETAADAVILLTDLLRFSMQDSGRDGKVRLSDEVEQINNLIQINMLRFEKTATVKLEESGVAESLRIIPLVLLTLVENIFKHGDFITDAPLIQLEILPGGKLRFYTRNKPKAKAPYPYLNSTGLQNIRIRLEYAYGNDFELNIQEQESLFEAELKLKL